MESDWLPGKIYAFTGEPLRIERLSLPPGSMVSFGHHMPHHVGHRNDDENVRWGLLMAFRTPDPTAQPNDIKIEWQRAGVRQSVLGPISTRWNESAPVHWAERMEAEGRLSESCRRLLEADKPIG